MPRKPKPALVEIGTTGLKSFSGRIDEEYHQRLRGGKAAKIYEEMSDNSAVVGAVLYAIETYLRRVSWSVVPANQSPEALKEAKFLEECMEDLDQTWEEFLCEVLTMLIYGYSLFEIVLKIRGGPQERSQTRRSKYTDGRYGWRSFAPRAQTSVEEWDLDQESNVLGVVQSAAPDYKRTYLPMNRCMLFRTKSRKNNPEGRSFLRNLYPLGILSSASRRSRPSASAETSTVSPSSRFRRCS